MTNTDEDDDDTNAKTEHQLLSTLGPLFERFSLGFPRARLKYKNVQEVDSKVLWIQMNFYPNRDGPTMISLLKYLT